MKSPSSKLRILVGGLVGQYPLGGVAWDYFHYLLGLAELGHDVYYHEDTWVWPHDPSKGWSTDDASYTEKFFKDFFAQFAPHLADRWCYVLLHDKCFGMTRQNLDEVAKSCDVYLNVSGACFIPDNLNPKAKRVFIDTDPGYNQVVMATRPSWSENVDRWIQGVRAHDVHLTYAENIWADDCLVPRVDIDWRPTRCVVTLADWAKVRAHPASGPFTTVMSWNYFKGPVAHAGVEYDSKVSEFEKFKQLPARSPVKLEMAVSGDKFDPVDIRNAGWTFIDARFASLTGSAYQNFISQSKGEWSVAKNVYAQTRSGWFSCRTACYLAAGRPAVVQDTAWSRYVASGAGLFGFITMDQCVSALEAVNANYAKHSRDAYEVAREYLAPDRVLTPMLEAIFATSSATAPLPQGLPSSHHQSPATNP